VQAAARAQARLANLMRHPSSWRGWFFPGAMILFFQDWKQRDRLRITS